MTYEMHNIARKHAIAARTALDAFRRQHAEAGLDWRSFETAVGLLDRAVEELRQPVRNLQPTFLAAGGFPAAMAYVLEEVQAADGPDTKFCEQAIDAEIRPKWKQAAVRITQESLANACRHSKSKRIFLELTLDGNLLHIHARDWGVSFKPGGTERGRMGLSRTCRRLKLLGGTATIDTEPGKGRYVTAEIALSPGANAQRHGPFTMSPRMRFGEE